MQSSTFQYILLVFFGFIGVLGVLIFAGIIPIGGESATYEGRVTLWGFAPQKQMEQVITSFNEANKNLLSIVYVEKDRISFENELINALARGEGPDLVMFSHDLLVEHEDKMFAIPYETYSERLFKDTFAEAGEIFLSKNGVVSLPLYANPLVMYWNRDIFTNSGLVNYPKTWIEVLNISPKLTKKDTKGTVFQSGVAMGGSSNVNNFKEILSALFLQVGNDIVSRKFDYSGGITKLFEPKIGVSPAGTEAALNFYLEFSNQAKVAYSWNNSLPSSRKMFESGKLAIYFGKASEYREIRANNPHLNFSVALLPQREQGNKRITYADVVGLSVVKNSKRVSTAFKAANLLTGADYSARITDLLGLPPLRRDLLGKNETDLSKSIFNESALISKAWVDPNSIATTDIFRGLVESVMSGKNDASSAIRDAQIKLFKYVK